MGDRVAVMRDGRLEQCDVPQRLYDRPANLFVAGFIGSPAMNLVRSSLTGEGDSLSLDLGGTALHLTPSVLERCPRLRSHVGRDVIVGIRPEDFEDAALLAESNGSCLDVDVALAEPMGAEVIAHFPLPVSSPGARSSLLELVDPQGGSGSTLTACLNPRSSAHAGGRLRLAVDIDRLHFFDEETEQAIS